MDSKEMIVQLESNARRIYALVEGVPAEQARWRPNPESWTLLEVINHLFDEEQFDFRVRLDLILHSPLTPWSPIDPQGWVTSRNYNERDLSDSIQKFLAERRRSLDWLIALGATNWEARVPTSWGSISAGDMFAAWVAHDLLHLRQLVELLHAAIVQISEPYDGEYAGPW
jgi:hypothetical protein